VLCISCKRGWCTSALLTQDTGAGWCGVMLRCGPVNLSTLYPRADDSPQHMVSVGRSMVRGPAGAIQESCVSDPETWRGFAVVCNGVFICLLVVCNALALTSMWQYCNARTGLHVRALCRPVAAEWQRDICGAWDALPQCHPSAQHAGAVRHHSM